MFTENPSILRVSAYRTLHERYALKLVELFQKFLEKIDHLAMISHFFKWRKMAFFDCEKRKKTEHFTHHGLGAIQETGKA